MKIIKKTILYLLALIMIYLGVLNKSFPWVLLCAYTAFGFLSVMWVLKPLITGVNLVHILKSANFLRDFNLIKLLIFTGGVIIGILGIETKGTVPEFNMIFLIMKILVSIIMEIVFLVSLSRKDISSPLG